MSKPNKIILFLQKKYKVEKTKICSYNHFILKCNKKKITRKTNYN